MRAEIIAEVERDRYFTCIFWSNIDNVFDMTVLSFSQKSVQGPWC